MTYKTRKRIWPAALMSLAIVGALAVVVALSVGGPQSASAHDCAEITDPVEQAKCLTVHARDGEDHDQNSAPVTSMPELDPITIVGVMVEDADGNQVNNTRTVEGVRAYFSDPEDDELTFTVGSDNTDAATGMLDDDGNLVITAHDAGEATITVTATDTAGNTAESTIMVTVLLSPAERYNLTPAAYEFDAPTAKPAIRQVTFTVSAVDADDSPLDEDATVNFLMRQFPADSTVSPLVTRVIGWDSSTDNDITDDNILQGLLTVRATDPDGERGFTVYFQCFAAGERVEIDMFDEGPELVGEGTISCKAPDAKITTTDPTSSDTFTVVSYGDEEYDKVTDGFILDVSNGNDHVVNDDLNETGLLSRDEPVIHKVYTLGVTYKETLEDLANGSPRRVKTGAGLTRQQKNADVEEGQRTIEVLVGQPHVQLTVTSKEAGPAYIRFVNSSGRTFGTDVDEEAMWRGADVVGLDSQGRLELNISDDLSAAEALAYDQYSIKTPDIVEGRPIENSELVGVPGIYNQGSFRFFNPCPSVGHHFYVQVYESTGKDLETTEKVMCVGSPRPGPTGLEFTVDSQEAGKGELTYRHALNADEHTVLLVDAHSRTIVTGGEIRNAPETVEFSAALGRALNNGWRYHFIVVAHGVNDQYTADAITITTEWINHPVAADSTLTARTPTRAHIVCQTNNAEVMAMLADCDAPLSAPSAVDATASGNVVTVTWTDGANADRHVVFLFDANFEVTPERIAGNQTDGRTTFNNVPAGTYTAVVVAVEDGASGIVDYKFGADSVTVN